MDWNSFKTKARTITEEVRAMLISTSWYEELENFREHLSLAMDEKWLKMEEFKNKIPSKFNLEDHYNFNSSLEKIKTLAIQNNWNSIETFDQWANTYFNELATHAQDPVFGKYAEQIFRFLTYMKVQEATAREFVEITSFEAIEGIAGGAISAAALIFAWKKEDKEQFSKSIGFILTSGTATRNPVMLIIAILALGFGYNKLVCKEAVARGVVSSGIGFMVSAAMPGPVLLGMIPALIATIWVNKRMGTDFRPIEFSKGLFDLARSEDFKKICTDLFEELKGKAQSFKKSA